MPFQTHSGASLRELLIRAGFGSETGEAFDRIQISHVTDDSRQVQPGTLFVALRGLQQDGHRYIDQAISAGASCVVLEDPAFAVRNVPCVIVEDSQDALARLSADATGLATLQQTGEMTVAGVTGTNGKSTTCHLLREILSRSGRPTALLGTIEYDLVGRSLEAAWTTPPAPRLAQYLVESHNHGARHAVMEVSSHALCQRRCNGVRYEVAVFTNLSGDHLDYHQDQECYMLSKRMLFDRLDEQATAVINADDRSADAMVEQCRARVLRFGIERPADVFATGIRGDITGSQFVLCHGVHRSDIHLPLVGMHNVSNALAASAAALALGIDQATIQAALRHASTVPGRLQQAQPPGHPYAVFVDYAHTDDALDQVLSTMKPLTKGRLWCVFGCGGDRDRTKRPRMARAAEKYADFIVVTSDNPRGEDPLRIIDDITAGFSRPDCREIKVEPDRRRAIELVVSEARPGDVVLIAGKGHEDYQLIGDQRLHFDDVEVVQTCLEACHV